MTNAADTTWQHRLAAATEVLAGISAEVGHTVQVEASELLNQRATFRELGPPGAISPGGNCRLMSAGTDWVAMTLSRRDDWDLIPALLGVDSPNWDRVTAAVAHADAAELSHFAGELGLAVAVLPDRDGPDDAQWQSRAHDRQGPWVVRQPADVAGPRALRRVVDLSALWAGPLCASLLRRAGAEVITVESPARPDGARTGDPELHRVLHEGNTFASLDLRHPSDIAELLRLIDDADIVISSSRPRALSQLGLDPDDVVVARPGLTWTAITAYGLTGPWSNRIGYGDDTAVAGGLVNRTPTPTFAGDAVADPITGLHAAIATLTQLQSGGGVVDIALRDVAAHLARPTAESE